LNALISNVLGRSTMPGGVQISQTLTPNLPMVRVDAEQLGRAMENLVVCQCVGLGEDDGLRVVSRARASRIYIELVDTGPGLSADEQAHLFDLKDADGFSMVKVGLVVARRLIQLNHACLEVESRQGMGTRFSIVISTR